ncbi:MAG: type II toxin-antitoxin system VapC family toxin [Dehalococcoidia bacterium]
MKASPEYVVDASVVVKWFSRSEEDVENSERLLNSHVAGTSTLVSSSLVLYEVCNALRFNPNFSGQDLSKAVTSLLKLGLELVDFSEIFESAIALACSQDITVYDAAYIAVSQTRHVPLITADYRLLARIKDIPFVMPLRETDL